MWYLDDEESGDNQQSNEDYSNGGIDSVDRSWDDEGRSDKQEDEGNGEEKKNNTSSKRKKKDDGDKDKKKPGEKQQGERQTGEKTGGNQPTQNTAPQGQNVANTSTQGTNMAGNGVNAGGNAAQGAGQGLTTTATSSTTTTATTTTTTTTTAVAGGATFAATIGWIILIIAIVILVIIILVGYICFFIFMPGQVASSLKEMGVKFFDAVQGIVIGEENVVHGKEIADIANYLESMGYDLKGEGFVTDDIQNNMAAYSKNEKPPENSYLDEQQGVYRSNKDKKVVAIYSEPIRNYIVSDNLEYLVKNFNVNLKEASDENGIVRLFSKILNISDFIISPVTKLESLFAFSVISNPNWGTGLISIWHEAGGIGKQGSYYGEAETGYISLDKETKQLKIKRGWTNNPYVFDVDGWSGRYGMPLEFLLSIHIATQMPDLAMDIATSFDTDVQVLLHEINSGSIEAGYQIGSGSSNNNDFLTYDQIMYIVQQDNMGITDLLNKYAHARGAKNFEAYTISDEEYYVLLKTGLPHSEKCTCCEHIPGGKGGNSCEKKNNSNNNNQQEDSFKEDDDRFNKDDENNSKNQFNISDHIICSECKDNIKSIINALAEVNKRAYYSYSPYISQVKNHWFRDVYFVINDINNTEVVVNDEQYFYETNERWSLYETYKEGEEIPEGFVVGDYKLYTYKEGQYTLFTGSKAEAEKINNKIAQGDTSVSRLVKKVITKKITDYKEEDGNYVLSGIKEEQNRWTAYKTEDISNGWSKIEVSEDTDDDVKKHAEKIYLKEERPNEIIQIEDGQRGPTNEKIKKMFIENKYYQYDGTVEKANKIIADRKNNLRYFDNTNKGDKVKISKNEEITSPGDNRKESLLGKVSIAKDSLTAFSMLENTHTLDADYIYKDFKELIVELNYFDKEELSDKIETVLTWPIPDCGSSGWPIRAYEKGEIFYGTLINSAVDLKLMKDKDLEEAKILMEELASEDGSTETETIIKTGTVPKGSVSNLVDVGYSVHKIMEGNGWSYNVARNKPTIHEALSAGKKYTCCATFVSWVLQEAGFDLSNLQYPNSSKSIYKWCVAEGWTPILNYDELQPGDIIFNRHDYNGSDVTQIGHVQMTGKKSGNNFEWLNAGSTNAINKAPYSYKAKFIIGMRSQMNGVAQEFEGYKGGQTVVSPITGKVVEYGTVKRPNVETGKEEEVEFIKIEAIDHYVYDVKDSIRDSGKGYLNCKKASDTFEEKVEDTLAKEREGYDYFYDEYRGVLDGYVLYIEGIDLTLFDSVSGVNTYESGSVNLNKYKDATSSEISRYEENTVYNMVDDLEEARSWWKEDAKAAALPLIEINGELYIKEGTVIGKTRSDEELMEDIDENTATCNGNYIRLILRNLDDSIVEDVESYFNLTDVYSFSGSAVDIQGIDGMNQELARLIEQKAGPLESKYPGIVNILKAISMNESSGGNNPKCGDDPMQAAESTGKKAGSSIGGWEVSVDAGIKALTNAWDKANKYGIKDVRVAIQAYNYGSRFVDYVHKQGSGTYTKKLAVDFSKLMCQERGRSSYGSTEYVDSHIYRYLPGLDV